MQNLVAKVVEESDIQLLLSCCCSLFLLGNERKLQLQRKHLLMPFCKELYRPLKIRVRGVDINGLLIVLYIFFIFKHLHTHSTEHNTHPIPRPKNTLIHSIERKMANCCNGRECIWSKRTTIYNQSNTIQYNTTQHNTLCSFALFVIMSTNQLTFISVFR